MFFKKLSRLQLNYLESLETRIQQLQDSELLNLPERGILVQVDKKQRLIRVIRQHALFAGTEFDKRVQVEFKQLGFQFAKGDQQKEKCHG